MNAIDTFYFLFKTDSSQAQTDIKKLDEQITALAAKGMQRTEAETKALNALRKLRGQATQDLKDQGKAADNLNMSFSKLALGGVAALEGFAALGKLKEGVAQAIDFNAQVERTAKLTNQNARELAIWNGVVARAGGDPNSKEYLNYISSLNKQYAGLGLNQRISKVNEDLGNVADKIKELNQVSAGSGYSFAQKLGIGDDLYLALKDGREALNENIALQARLNNTTSESTANAFELKQEWQEIGTSWQSAFNSAIPLARAFLGVMEGLARATRIFFDLITLPFGGGSDLKRMWKSQGEEIRHGLDKWNKAPPSSGAEQESSAFWKSQGYSDAQVAALLANEKTESGFNSSAVGDNGQARGIFQWHPDRRQKILAATGIDVTNASHADQLRAAAWELNQTGAGDRLRATETPTQGARVLTNYEAPANPQYQAYLRGQSAEGYYARMGQSSIASADSAQLPGGNSSKTISIGAITIQTQATDAKGIARDFHGALTEHLQSTAGAFDDGVKL